MGIVSDIYYKNPFLHCFIAILLLFLISTGKGISQDEQFLKSILSDSDLKSIKKADELITEADGLIDKANQLYLETFSVQANYDLSEKQRAKKVNKLESDARKLQFDAADNYQKANQEKFEIYKKYIEEFWKDFSGDESQYVNAQLIEEQGNDFYFQANTLRSNAKGEPDELEKIKKLNEAYELELKAIDKTVAALGYYYGMETTPEIETTEVTPTEEPYSSTYDDLSTYDTITPVEEVVTEPVTTYESTDYVTPQDYPTASETTTGDVVVNPQMLEMYNRYISSTTPSESVVSSLNFQDISNMNPDEIRDLWYSYEYDLEPPKQLIAEELADTTVSDIDLTEEQAYMADEIEADRMDISTEDVVSTIEEPGGKTIEYEQEISTVDQEVDASYLPSDEDVIYRIQVAANKTPLSQRALQNMYYGNKGVEMITENGWYKYSVGDFDTYKEADDFRSSSGIKNAFIVAYRRGTKFYPSASGETAYQQPKEAVDIRVDVDTRGLIFNVQIAASRAPMSKSQLAYIYNGNLPIEMREEEGWYKYQIGWCRLYTDAVNIQNNTDVKGAFIVAYNEGIKLYLSDAVSQIKSLEQAVRKHGRIGTIQEILFQVQVAASRAPISEGTLLQIYNGNLPVTLVIEEGWYKYRIKAGTDYTDAVTIRDQCYVTNAFIVAYRRGKKMELFKAIRESKTY